MKKFLSKLPVMITFLVVTVLMAGLYIGLLARPYAQDWKNTYCTTTIKNADDEDPTNDVKVTTNVKVVFNSNKLLTMSFNQVEDYGYASTFGGETIQFWYLRDGKSFVLLGEKAPEFTEKEYKEAVAQYWAMEKADREATYANETITVNAFKMVGPSIIDDGNVTYKCTGSVVYAVLMGIALAASTTFATLSVVFFVKSKKHA